MKETGSILKANRQKKNLSLQEVSMATKISPRVLTAMEEGSVDKLPQISFLRGFVKSYANYLEADVDKILLKFKDEMEVHDEPVSISEEEIKSRKQKKRGIASKTIAVVGIIGLIIVAATVKSLIEKYQKEGEKAEVPKAITSINPSDKKIQSASILKIKRTDQNKTATPSKSKPDSETLKKIALEKKQAQKRDDELAEEKNRAKIAKQKEQEEITKKTKVKNQIQEVTNKPKKLIPVLLNHEVIIEALDQVTIKYSIDSQNESSLVLSPDQLHTFKGKKKLRLSFSDGGAVNVIYNGRDRGVPGDLGSPKSIKFP